MLLIQYLSFATFGEATTHTAQDGATPGITLGQGKGESTGGQQRGVIAPSQEVGIKTLGAYKSSWGNTTGFALRSRRAKCCPEYCCARRGGGYT